MASPTLYLEAQREEPAILAWFAKDTSGSLNLNTLVSISCNAPDTEWIR